MKTILIAFMAFALTLGVACKKDSTVEKESKPLKIEKSATEPPKHKCGETWYDSKGNGHVVPC